MHDGRAMTMMIENLIWQGQGQGRTIVRKTSKINQVSSKVGARPPLPTVQVSQSCYVHALDVLGISVSCAPHPRSKFKSKTVPAQERVHRGARRGPRLAGPWLVRGGWEQILRARVGGYDAGGSWS